MTREFPDAYYEARDRAMNTTVQRVLDLLKEDDDRETEDDG